MCVCVCADVCSHSSHVSLYAVLSVFPCIDMSMSMMFVLKDPQSCVKRGATDVYTHFIQAKLII